MSVASRQQLADSKQQTVDGRRLTTHGSRAQSTLEYAVLTAAIMAALSAMLVYARRAVEANLFEVERQMNTEAVGPVVPVAPVGP